MHRAATLLIVLAAIVLLGIKTYYIQLNNRFMPFGFDTPRIMGYTQHLIAFGKLESFASHRYGLPVFAAIFIKVFSLPPSQAFIIPLWTINTVSGLLLMLFAYVLTRNQRTAILTLLLFSLAQISAPVNDSHFMGYSIAPLRFILLTIILQENRLKKRSAIPYIAGVLMSNLTYPIISLGADVLTFVTTAILFAINKVSLKTFRFLILTQIIAYIVLFGVYQFDYRFALPFLSFFERAYSLALTQIPRIQVASVVGSFFIAEIISLLYAEKVKPVVQKAVAYFTQPACYLAAHLVGRLVAVVILIMLYSKLVNVFGPVLMEPSLIDYDQAMQLIQSILSAGMLSLFLSGHLSASKQPLLFSLVSLSSIYLLYNWLSQAQGSQSFLSNPRIYLLFSPLIYIGLSHMVNRLKKKPRAFALYVLGTVFIVLSLISIKGFFIIGGNRPVIQAMDWFSRQPDYQNSLFYASYFNSPNLTGHEKYDSLYFVASKTPWQDQYDVGKCSQEEQICLKRYRDYLEKKRIKYLVLEDGQESNIYQELLNQGDIIYDLGVKIIKRYE